MVQKPREEDESRSKYEAGLAYMIPTLMFSGPLTGFVLGWIVVKAFGLAEPWSRRATIACVLIGTVSGIWESVKVVKKITKSQRSGEK